MLRLLWAGEVSRPGLRASDGLCFLDCEMGTWTRDQPCGGFQGFYNKMCPRRAPDRCQSHCFLSMFYAFAME